MAALKGQDSCKLSCVVPLSLYRLPHTAGVFCLPKTLDLITVMTSQGTSKDWTQAMQDAIIPQSCLSY